MPLWFLASEKCQVRVSSVGAKRLRNIFSLNGFIFQKAIDFFVIIEYNMNQIMRYCFNLLNNKEIIP